LGFWWLLLVKKLYSASHPSYALCTESIQRPGQSEGQSEQHEAHMVFRCAALSVQRREHTSLFSPWPESLRSFMGQDPKTLAAFAYACYKKDKELKTYNLPVRATRRS